MHGKSKVPLDLNVSVFDEVETFHGRRCMYAETVEAEIVFLVRQHGWVILFFVQFFPAQV